MEKAIFIYNPKRGKSNFIPRIDEITAVCREQGVIPSFWRLNTGEGFAGILPYLGEYEKLFISGGDGTVNLVLNQLLYSGVEIPVGIIPSGTANDFASALGMDPDPVIAVQSLLAGTIHRVDAGDINGMYFASETGAGLLTAISHEASTALKNRLGKAGYYLKGLEKIWKPVSIPVTVEGEGFTLDREITVLLVANTPVVGSFKNMAPRARLSDGLLDAVVLKKCSPEQLVLLLLQAFRGKGEHLNNPLVEYYQSPWFKITSPARDVNVVIDGEPGVSLPLDIKVLPGKLPVIFPSNSPGP